MNELIKYFNNKHSKTHGKIAYPRTTLQIYQVYQIIKDANIEDEKLNKLLNEIVLPNPKTIEEKEAYAECIYESVNTSIDKKYIDNFLNTKLNAMFLFNENGELVVTIGEISKTFVPKSEVPQASYDEKSKKIIIKKGE